jgi:transcriptional regulator with XRE-family HTH domain
MSRTILGFSTEKIELDFGQALRHLRERLGGVDDKGKPIISQDEMARLLGAKVQAYIRWESGKHDPGGVSLIKMLSLCPDAASLKEFGLDIAKLQEQYPSSQVKPEASFPFATSTVSDTKGETARDGKLTGRYQEGKLSRRR